MSLQKTAEMPKTDKPSMRSYLAKEWNRRRENTGVLLMDIVHIALAFLFARCHVLLGAYPLGIALLAALSHRVFITLPGAVLGALSMGRAGVVYALASVITVLLRMAVSGTAGARGDEGGALFREKRPLRACSAVIGAFICGVYEVLLYGFALTAVLYAAAMTVTAGITAYLFSGIELVPVSAREYVLGTTPLYAGRHRTELTGRHRVECELAQAAFLFFIPYTLRSVELFGISAAYIFAAFSTLFFARRFGPLRGMAAGFLSTLGLSTTHAVSYALGGLGAGLLFPLGVGYALVVAAGAVGAWGALSEGLIGFVTAFPEFAVSAALVAPLCKHLSAEPAPEKTAAAEQSAADMVGTMALAHRGRSSEGHTRLEQALASLTPVLKSHLPSEDAPRADDVRRLLRQTVEATCRRCAVAEGCSFEAQSVAVDALVRKVIAKEVLYEEDFFCYSGEREERERLLEAFRHRLAADEAERHREQGRHISAKLCEVVAKMMNEVRAREEREAALDTELSRRLTEIMVEHGFPEAVARVYGDRRKYVLAAAEDEEGEAITDPRLLSDMAAACGVTLSEPSYFRKGPMVLLESRSTRRFSVETATAGAPRGSEEITGDSVAVFEDADDTQYLVLSDGMGTGEDAHRASSLAASYLSCMMGAGCSEGTAMYLLNHLLRTGGDECSATVDLFSFDLVRGEGQFYKSGAAPSYLKRASSLFRIRSQTSPVGLLRTLDAERIKVDVRPGDVIILLSDGISASPEDDPWLVELLSRPVGEDLGAFARQILDAACRQGGVRDDMTVLVARIAAA